MSKQTELNGLWTIVDIFKFIQRKITECYAPDDGLRFSLVCDCKGECVAGGVN